jgi:cytochrome c553
MKISKILLSFSLCAAACFPLVGYALDGDPVAGQNKTSMCAGCHGIEGMRTAYPEVYSVPKLGGQNASYIVAALSAYRSGARKFATMRAIVHDLSDQDMADLAAYYSSVEMAK